MESIALTMSAATKVRMEDAFAGTYDRPETIENPDLNVDAPISADNPLTIPNPESKADFLKRWYVEHSEKVVKGWEHDVAKDAAVVTADAAAKSINIT